MKNKITLTFTLAIWLALPSPGVDAAVVISDSYRSIEALGDQLASTVAGSFDADMPTSTHTSTVVSSGNGSTTASAASSQHSNIAFNGDTVSVTGSGSTFASVSRTYPAGVSASSLFALRQTFQLTEPATFTLQADFSRSANSTTDDYAFAWLQRNPNGFNDTIVASIGFPSGSSLNPPISSGSVSGLLDPGIYRVVAELRSNASIGADDFQQKDAALNSLSFSVTTLPEPSVSIMLGFALILFLLARRRVYQRIA